VQGALANKRPRIEVQGSIPWGNPLN
jgi:Plus-3 domain